MKMFLPLLMLTTVLLVTGLFPACTSDAPPAPTPAAQTAGPAFSSGTATPVALQKVLDDISQFNDGAIADFNSPAGQQLLNAVGVGVVNVLADYSAGNSLGAGIAGGTALAGALSDAAQLPTTTAQLAQINVAGAKVSGDAAAVAPFVAKIIKAAQAKMAASVKATVLIQKAAQAVQTVSKVPSAVKQVIAIGNP